MGEHLVGSKSRGAGRPYGGGPAGEWWLTSACGALSRPHRLTGLGESQNSLGCCPLDFVTEAVARNPDSIADLYRSLRKADEDARNEPAAADFYYGEMEMRRASGDGPRSEHALLFLYWLVSGYGLRASRAFAALVLTVLLFAIGFSLWGFAGSATFTEALLYSANSTVSLLRAPVRELTTVGGFMDIALRLLGPLFFGLILVSLRGRIKR